MKSANPNMKIITPTINNDIVTISIFSITSWLAIKSVVYSVPSILYVTFPRISPVCIGALIFSFNWIVGFISVRLISFFI